MNYYTILCIKIKGNNLNSPTKKGLPSQKSFSVHKLHIGQTAVHSITTVHMYGGYARWI